VVSARVPAVPEGQGPVLEWFQTTTRDSLIAGILVAVLVAAIFTLKDWGFGWISVWWLWIFVVACPLIFYLYGRGERLAAGADWYKYGRRYVKTYELTSVKVQGTSAGAAWDLDLEDSSGRKLTTQLGVIQQNPRLWDLVYNGILHSVRNGAETNRRAVERLQLR